jgi:hypothetical protein
MMLKSVFLSEYRFSDGHMMEKWLEELEGISAALARGEAYNFSPMELDRMREVRARLASENSSWMPLIRYFRPAVMLLLALFLLLLLLKMMK